LPPSGTGGFKREKIKPLWGLSSPLPIIAFFRLPSTYERTVWVLSSVLINQSDLGNIYNRQTGRGKTFN